MKLIVELTRESDNLNKKSRQSRGLTPPLAKALAMITVASMTHENGLILILATSIVSSFESHVKRHVFQIHNLALEKHA